MTRPDPYQGTAIIALDRIRERAESNPVETLSDGELLSLALGRDVRAALEASGFTLRQLATLSLPDLERLTSPATARRAWAFFHLARRVMRERLRPGVAFLSPAQIFDHYHAMLRDEKREHFLCVLLDARHRVMRDVVVSVGSLTSAIVHPREVFRPAVREAAGAVVFVHNHPSGDPQPSEEDLAVTRRLCHASELLDIRVLDHVVIGDGSYSSFKEAGLL